MKKRMLTVIFTLLSIFCLSGTAKAADYKAGWGKGLDSGEVQAMVLLKAEAKRLCSEKDSDYERVRKLNEYVCDGAAYDYGYTAEGLKDFVYQGKAICSGYAKTLSFLLDCADVKNMTVTAYVDTPGGSELHIWNVVYIGGQWLHIDPTWNDSSRSSTYPNGRYFLLSDEKIREGRQGLLLQTPQEYDHYYNLTKTATLSFQVAGGAEKDNQAGEALFTIRQGRIWVPVRQVFSLGGYIKQDESGEISILLGTRVLHMTTGSRKAHIDDEDFLFDSPPQIIEGEIMVPARTVFEKLGATVRYDSDTSNVTISYDPYKKKQ